MKKNRLQISIVIPVLNEAKGIAQTINYLTANSSPENIKEILIVDGGSADNTAAIAEHHGARVIHSAKGRAKQLNYGAKNAKGAILYFLHADTLPPHNFDQSVIDAIEDGFETGCFQMKFDSNSIFLSFFAWFTRVNHQICRGGDQSLFITKELFNSSGGFNEAYVVYEDNEFIGRLYKSTFFKILPRHVKTSARRYQERGMVKLQYHFGIMHLKNYLGAGPDQLYDYYKRKISV
ncbi:TIGR04283 family arsenosugar biosynthesis glycosyltransferase [Zobellia laminariae]|uniref:TIGR04283 family arsenosugar biosynthesis glycosyltransferase n=1 Tax=Zobellia laminariae TaxID=248906 RepID=UPI0026F43A41|nr:TIGR04283 family arsenosugar biosynthesis glycosyltransferase [Zobellia laminariae]WKX77566.1 TIGR04283 family arsenosugar biosynthesis glycosyltransferase [Zobellia laminariae]